MLFNLVRSNLSILSHLVNQFNPMPLLVNLKNNNNNLVQSDLRLVGFKRTMIFYLFFFFPGSFLYFKTEINFQITQKKKNRIIVRENESYKEITNK